MLKRIMRDIQKADAREVDEILDAAMARRKQLYPDWEMVYFAVPKNDPRERQLLKEMTERYKNLR